MSYSIASLLLIQIILIALNAVFASAELAVLSVNESRINRLAEQGSKKARRLRKLTKEPAKFLSTIQIAITLSGFLGSAFAADGFSDPLVDWLIGLGVTLPRNTLDTLSVSFYYAYSFLLHADFWRIGSQANCHEKSGGIVA